MSPSLCPKEIAAILGVTPRTVRAMMRAGELPAFRVGRLLRCALIDVTEYVARSQISRPAEAFSDSTS
jgi:excisionase family DNA binding protein